VRLDALDEKLPLRIADHVAVDRWTGGAAESRLFSVLEPMGAAWEPMRLRLDCRRAGGGGGGDGGGGGVRVGDQRLALALLLLVLRDLAGGWLAFGFGSTRGQGHVAVSRISFGGADVPEPWNALLAAETLDAVLTAPPAAVSEAMEHWTTALVPEKEQERERGREREVTAR
jgi:hypothetical protein